VNTIDVVGEDEFKVGPEVGWKLGIIGNDALHIDGYCHADASSSLVDCSFMAAK
jgi:hypothetical protein